MAGIVRDLVSPRVSRTDLLTLDDLPASLGGAAVFLRVDFNVPMSGERVSDDTRLREARPTIEELLERGGRVLLASHLGRPRGEPDPRLSLRPVADHLAGLLGRPVAFAPECIGPERQALLSRLGAGGLALLENLRFHPGETENDDAFARALAEGCSMYVDDAFGCAHRAHASVAAIVRAVPRRAAGRLLVREVEILSGLLEQPERPFLAALGGAKISGKIETLENLVETVDVLLLGGGMANTFLASQGHHLGRSLVEHDRLDLAARILARARERGITVLLPEDLVATDDLARPAAERRIQEVPVARLPAELMAVDVGARTCERYGEAIARARTLFWNGPMGVFETPPFERGSFAIARSIGASAAFAVIGGGETAAVVRLAGVADRIDWISTGGGAALELLAGLELPGVAALRRGA